MALSSRVIPAILTDDSAALQSMIHLVEKFTDYAQVDIMDGKFVPSRSIGVTQLSRFPERLKWEAHLMVVKPQDYLVDLKQAGGKRVIFHYEATDKPQEIVTMARNYGLEVGLALNPETPVAAIFPLAQILDSVLFMSVNPGYYGAPFLPQVLEKIIEFRATYPEFEIGIDGGVKESNIGDIARSGVDYICVGSAIFLQPDPAESFRRLTKLAQGI
ncbi:ribulose-phosphate 3-epimerase [Chloroflexota bacterium]